MKRFQTVMNCLCGLAPAAADGTEDGVATHGGQYMLVQGVPGHSISPEAVSTGPASLLGPTSSLS